MASQSSTETWHWTAGLNALPAISRSEQDGWLKETRQFRGLTVDQAIRYLENLGGKQIDKSTIEGDSWQATLSTDIVPVGPSYRLTEITITWEGPVDDLKPVITAFRTKAFRAPG